MMTCFSFEWALAGLSDQVVAPVSFSVRIFWIPQFLHSSLSMFSLLDTTALTPSVHALALWLLLWFSLILPDKCETRRKPPVARQWEKRLFRRSSPQSRSLLWLHWLILSKQLRSRHKPPTIRWRKSGRRQNSDSFFCQRSYWRKGNDDRVLPHNCCRWRSDWHEEAYRFDRFHKTCLMVLLLG